MTPWGVRGVRAQEEGTGGGRGAAAAGHAPRRAFPSQAKVGCVESPRCTSVTLLQWVLTCTARSLCWGLPPLSPAAPPPLSCPCPAAATPPPCCPDPGPGPGWGNVPRGTTGRGGGPSPSAHSSASEQHAIRRVWGEGTVQHEKQQGGHRGPVPNAGRMLVEACFRIHAPPVHDVRDGTSGHAAAPVWRLDATMATETRGLRAEAKCQETPTASLTASSDRGRLLSSRACKASASSAPSPGCMPQTCDLAVDNETTC